MSTPRLTDERIDGILSVMSHQLDLPIPGTDFEDGKPRIHVHAKDAVSLIEYVQALRSERAKLVEGLRDAMEDTAVAYLAGNPQHATQVDVRRLASCVRDMRTLLRPSIDDKESGK